MRCSRRYLRRSGGGRSSGKDEKRERKEWGSIGNDEGGGGSGKDEGGSGKAGWNTFTTMQLLLANCIRHKNGQQVLVVRSGALIANPRWLHGAVIMVIKHHHEIMVIKHHHEIMVIKHHHEIMVIKHHHEIMVIKHHHEIMMIKHHHELMVIKHHHEIMMIKPSRLI